MNLEHIFVGFDNRQTVNSTVCHQSILMHSSRPVAIVPLTLPAITAMTGFERRGLTPFTYSRFLVPWIAGYQGWAIFCDSDIVFLSDPMRLIDECQGDKLLHPMSSPAVWIRDKSGFEFERAGLMVMWCGHPAWKSVTPEAMNDPKVYPSPHKIERRGDIDGIFPPEIIGRFSEEWGVLVGYEAIDPNMEFGALHYTQGTPCHEETSSLPGHDQWYDIFSLAVSTEPWIDTMGNSVHAYRMQDGRVLPRGHADAMASMDGSPE